MKENRQQNRDELNQALLQTKQTVMKQASLAVVAVVVTVVMVFAMTVAWYSNVLHTSDLTFQAKTWDFTFEGTINLRSGNQVLAAPGDSGFVNLSVANVSNKTNLLGADTNVSTIGVTVQIDKTDLGILNNRLYFYVDKQTDIDGEIVDQIYINDSDSYTYTIFPGKTLSLSEEYYNDYPIKWHWVYDVTGYYVRGQLQSDNTIAIEEYIRPIEFETAEKLVYDENGNITHYDTETIDDYIYNHYLTKDGYEGGYSVDVDTITLDKITDTEGNTVQNLYRINDNLWIVLCTKDEIEVNNQIDTMLGKNQPIDEESDGTQNFSARIILTGSKVSGDPVKVESGEWLIENINNGTSVFELTNDLTDSSGAITLSDAVVVKAGTDTVIDLGGHTLKMSQPIEMEPNSSLGIINGTLTISDEAVQNGEKVVMINASSAEIYLDNIISTGFYSGIEIYDSTSESSIDSHVHISQSQIETKDSVVWLRGNGEKSLSKTTLVIEDSNLTSTEYIAVGGNGTGSLYGTDIRISSTTLTGKYAAIFHPMNKSTMTVTSSTLNGEIGVAIKGGTIAIDNCTVAATGTVESTEARLSGFAAAGAGIYIEDNYSSLHGYEIDVVITGENTYVKSTHGKAVFWNDGTAEKTGLAVFAGKYESSNTVEDTYLSTFEDKYLAEGKVVTQISDEKTLYEVNDAPAATAAAE